MAHSRSISLYNGINSDSIRIYSADRYGARGWKTVAFYSRNDRAALRSAENNDGTHGGRLFCRNTWSRRDTALWTCGVFSDYGGPHDDTDITTRSRHTRYYYVRNLCCFLCSGCEMAGYGAYRVHWTPVAWHARIFQAVRMGPCGGFY